MDIPGTVTKHAIITDECRENRGSEAAILEAAGRVIKEYQEIAKAWPVGSGAKFHVVLTLERPTQRWKACPTCGGTGSNEVFDDDTNSTGYIDCISCQGTGRDF